jgi:hypothetical protein
MAATMDRKAKFYKIIVILPTQSNPENTPTLNLGRVGGFSSVKIGGGIGTSQLAGFFGLKNSQVHFFNRRTTNITHFTGSHLRPNETR